MVYISGIILSDFIFSIILSNFIFSPKNSLIHQGNQLSPKVEITQDRCLKI